MTGAVTAFSTDHPDVFTWKTECDRISTEWRDRARQLDQAHPDHTVMYSYFGALDAHVVGLKGKESPGEGWRLNKRGEWVGDKRTKAGKDIARTIQALRYQFPHCPGMPEMVSSVKRWHHVGWDEFQGELWATFSCSVEDVRRGGWSKVDLDETIWVVRPLSAYYLAKEAAA